MPNMRTAVDRACEHFQTAASLITEGDRPAAVRQLRSAIKTLKGHHGAAEHRRDLEQSLPV